MLLADAQENRDILLADDMTLAEYGILGDALDYLCDVVAQNLSHGVFRPHQFHTVSPSCSVSRPTGKNCDS